MWPMDGGTIIAFSNDDVAKVPEVGVEICLGFVPHEIACLLASCFFLDNSRALFSRDDNDHPSSPTLPYA